MTRLQSATWKRVGFGTLTLASAVLLMACGNKSTATSSNKDEISWYTPTEIITLDISKNTDTYSGLAIGNSGSNLLRADEKGKLQPDLAKKVEVSEDGLTYTATLRDNLKWSDGSKLTAEDFVYTWRRMVDPATASEYAYLATEAHLENAEEINSGKNSDLSSLGVKADGDKVIFTLTKPAPQFKSLLSFGNFVPQKESFVKEAGKDYGTSSDKQIYSGPYTVKDWNGTSGSFKLVKNKNYWDAKHVKTKTIKIQTVKKPDTAVQMYKQGKLDFANISGTPAIYNANKKNKDAIPVLEATTAYMVYNQTGSVEGLSNLKIRQALNLATDRKGIVSAAVDTGSKAATAIVPTGLAKLKDGTDLTKHVSPGYKYDEKEAAKLFKEGLSELGKDSLKLTITADADNPVAKAMIDYIKETWESVLPGLTVEEKFVPFKQRLEDTKNQNFEVAVALWGGDYPEGSTFYGLMKSDSSYNYGKFSNQAFDNAYEKALTTDALDTKAAADDYKEGEKALYEAANYNPLYFRSGQGLQNPSLKGLIRNTTGLNVDFTYAYKK
ncbi:peptide ABC transporter substrate-binding protein [Streptococcus ictaluri]|uniref:ABC transporter, substrate-binding protein, family 5 n=1 Tax=Streptococcus ictaluri 707-05 TaxID=764299 RepID=G5K4Y9_9STRE|nr:peptide ABC transporter substrate-binding protein [Streptococcus ictaluri]EHI69269.1 ABC transporter, substrate-binding protein, family 5 [Streptococcus ictaluri 707-05]